MPLKGHAGVAESSCPQAAQSCVCPGMLYFLVPMCLLQLFSGLLENLPSSPTNVAPAYDLGPRAVGC